MTKEKNKIPRRYMTEKKEQKEYIEALEALGKVIRKQGPIDEKTGHLIQLAAAIAIRSEGAVHSHVRRAIESGATYDEIYHAIILLTSTIGFPTVSAALSWAEDIMPKPHA